MSKPHDKTYTPIDCGLYSQYELSIMRKQALRIIWQDSKNLTHLQTIYPINLRTRWHAEFMIAKNLHGTRHILRLDRISFVEVLPKNKPELLTR